jgi:predicted amidophosphoribosyltransferase
MPSYIGPYEMLLFLPFIVVIAVVLVVVFVVFPSRRVRAPQPTSPSQFPGQARDASSSSYGPPCTSCSVTLPPNGTYCSACGAPVNGPTTAVAPEANRGSFCRTCGSRLGSGDRFCSVCGEPVVHPSGG